MYILLINTNVIIKDSESVESAINYIPIIIYKRNHVFEMSIQNTHS